MSSHQTEIAGSIDTNRYEHRIYSSYSVIVKTHQSGKSLQNKWGGYSPINVGQHGYVAKKFASIRKGM